MSFPLIVAWAYGPKHEAAANRLAFSLHERGHVTHVQVFADLRFPAIRPSTVRERYWVFRYAAVFLECMLREYGGPDVLYLHADHVIQAPIPPTAWAGLDIGLQDREPGRTYGLDVMAAPLFVRNNENGRSFVREWRSLCLLAREDVSEHVLLSRLFYLRQGSRVGYFREKIASPWKNADTPIRDDKVL